MNFTFTSPASLNELAGLENLILALWNRAFKPEFRLTAQLWRQNTLGDPGFRPADLRLARAAGGELAGLVLSKMFREAAKYPGQNLEKYAPNGYITALAVRPDFQGQGLGRQLLYQAEEQLKREGARRLIPGGSFRHFFPGLPAGYDPALKLFTLSGYRFDPAKTNWDLDGPLAPGIFEPALAAVEGATYRQGHGGDEAALLAFLTRVFPGRWFYDTRLFLEQGGPIEDITLALGGSGTIEGFLITCRAGSKVLGPGLYWLSEQPGWGGIGPLGISPEARGRGAGLGLVAAGMQYLHSRGVSQARIDWTTLTGFYGRLGFRPSITYLLGSKE